MEFAMVCAAARHGELAAHVASQGARLGEPNMMRIPDGPGAADEARLSRPVAQALLVVRPARLRQDEGRAWR
jgi:hypothetical protein